MTLLSFKPLIPAGTPRRRDDRAKEDMFLECYAWLIECALNITHGQRERAEDLVHDVFVRFLDNDVEVSSICNIRGYLNGMLRNLHLLQLRRATRHPVQSLTLIDHDSALVGLRAWNSVEQFQSADLLLRACDFVCYRKEVALTSSVLILRFFHGFYPGEICRLLKAKRHAVDKWIERGRNETKQFLESPCPLPNATGTESGKAIPKSSTAFLRRLRERIFNSCTTDCTVLIGNSEPSGVREFAHLVSCRTCLSRRSREMGLAHVAERMVDDISDRDDGRPEGGAGGSGKILSLGARRKISKRAILRDVYERRRELFEHRPKEISLAFDGVSHATLLVNAATNTLNLTLDRSEVPNSLAVLSEQEFNFLLLDRDQLMCRERGVHSLSLSDDRFLEVTITAETLGPSIQVVYEDPSFLVRTELAGDQEPQTITAEEPILTFPVGRVDSSMARPAWRTAWLEKFRSLVPAMNPFLATAIVLGAATVLCLILWLRGGPPLSAGELLDHAQTSDRSAATSKRPGVIYQKVAIRTPRRTVERTIYRDAQGIRRPRRQELSPEDEQLKNKLASAGVSWDDPLSAADYADWRRRSGLTRDRVTRPGQQLLTLSTAPVADEAVLNETLTVRETDFHAVGRTVELRDTGTVEIAQLNYDVLPWGAVNQDWFEPVPPGAVTDAPGLLSPSIHASPLTELDLETELAVRYALHEISADLGEPIDIRVGGHGSVSVVGMVSSADRKQELLAALKGIRGAVTKLQTEEEAEPRKLPDPVTHAEPLIVTVHSPIEKELLDYFHDPLAVENASKRAIAVAGDLMAHAWALRHLSDRYGAPGTSGQRPLSSASRQLLGTMRRDHYRAMSDETSELTALLGPVLRSIVQTSPEPTTRSPLFNCAQSVQRLTLDLASGSGSSNGTEISEPAKAAEDLLAALRTLEIALEEQP